MAEHPILFSGPLVRAILERRKTVTRRPVNPQPSEYTPSPNVHATTRTEAYFDSYCNRPKSDKNPRGMSEHWCWWSPDNRQGPDWNRCPFGVPGDLLYVREAWRVRGGDEYLYQRHQPSVVYRADAEVEPPDYGICDTWKPSIHMPRWASRITLHVESVEVVRLQHMRARDALEEGVEPRCRAHHDAEGYGCDPDCYLHEFQRTWDSIYPQQSWVANPFVWVVSFSVAEVKRG